MRTGSTSKKRPDLLHIDFGEDRERPSSPSPSPLAEAKALPSSEENKPRFASVISTNQIVFQMSNPAVLLTVFSGNCDRKSNLGWRRTNKTRKMNFD